MIFSQTSTIYVRWGTIEGIIIVDGRPQIERADMPLTLSFDSIEELEQAILSASSSQTVDNDWGEPLPEKISIGMNKKRACGQPQTLPYSAIFLPAPREAPAGHHE